MVVYDEAMPIRFSDPLPDAVDVIVIGAGVIGISTALYLAEAGLKVLVCDKGRVAGEQSSRNWGWIRQQMRDVAELPIMMDSINQWETWAGMLDEDIGFKRSGLIYLAETQQQLQQYENWIGVAQAHQLDSRLLSGREVDRMIDDKPGQWRGALYTPTDGRAEPFKAVPALARLLRARGGLIREHCAVRSIDREAGRCVGVITEKGRVRANSVVCAAGAWSSLFLGNIGIPLPQLTVRATVARTEPAPNIFDGNASAIEVAIRRRADGGYTIAASNTNEHFPGADSFRHFFKFLPAARQSARYIQLRLGDNLIQRLLPIRRWRDDEVSPFELDRVLNPAVSPAVMDKMRAGLARRFPRLARLKLVESWAGMIDVTPDVVPVLDGVASCAGLFIATGFSGHGFGIGPGAGRVMADMVLERLPVHDLARFRLARFTDGTQMTPGPGL